MLARSPVDVELSLSSVLLVSGSVVSVGSVVGPWVVDVGVGEGTAATVMVSCWLIVPTARAATVPPAWSPAESLLAVTVSGLAPADPAAGVPAKDAAPLPLSVKDTPAAGSR